MNYSEAIGAIGVALILAAYFLNVFSFVKKDQKSYLFLNIVGASLACYAAVLMHYLPFIVLEGTWVIVSIVGIVNVNRKAV